MSKILQNWIYGLIINSWLIQQDKDSVQEMSSSQKQHINSFISLTGTSKQIAQKYLTKSKWNFQQAINIFYDEGAPVPEAEKIKTIPEVEKFLSQNSKIQHNVNIINEQALEKLFSEILNIADDNIVVGHMMINIMGMKKAGQATRENLYKLFQYTKSKSFHQLASKIPQLEKQLKERKDLFRTMYQGFYQFYSVTKVPTLDFEVAVQIWDVYFKHFMAYHKQFVEFLNVMQKKPAKIYKDPWKMVYQFATSFKSLGDYNQDDGWPLMIDDFINYLKQKEVK